jgi:hypothetical protein
MITALVFALAGGLADVEPPKEAQPPASIMDLFADDSVDEYGWSEEPERYRRCRLYRCGLPHLPQLERLLNQDDGRSEPDER